MDLKREWVERLLVFRGQPLSFVMTVTELGLRVLVLINKGETIVVKMISKFFDDKRLTCLILIVWLVIVLTIFSHMGIMQTQFMSFGPSASTEFMGIPLHSWPRWSCVAIFTFLSTAINDFVGDAVVPWIQNTVQDHKTRYIPYSKFTCWSITQCWSIYCCIMSIFSIYLLMSQIDFLIIRAFADTLVNSYTTYRFLRGKKKNMAKYNAKYGQDATDTESDNDDDNDDDDPDKKQLVNMSTRQSQSNNPNDLKLDMAPVETAVTVPTTPTITPKVTPRSDIPRSDIL